jgi:hypothetical protein
VDFVKIDVESSYWDWMRQMIYSLYDENYYIGFNKTKFKLHSLPNLNVVVSPVRVT